jgi:putative peptide zinc metalloprotease protein
VVTGWVLCVVPLLVFILGDLMLHLPQTDRALWRSASLQGHLMAGAVAGHRYALAALDAIGAALVALSLAGSLYIVIRLARRAATAGLRWSAGRPARRRRLAAAALACMTGLAAFWTIEGQFRGW